MHDELPKARHGLDHMAVVNFAKGKKIGFGLGDLAPILVEKGALKLPYPNIPEGDPGVVPMVL